VDQAQRRRELLEVAADLVARKGPDALTMERLADEAKIGKPLVYKQFASRSDLIVALLESEWEQLGVHIRPLFGTPGSEEEIVRENISRFFDFVEQRDSVLHTIAFDGDHMRQPTGTIRVEAEELELRFQIDHQSAHAFATFLVSGTHALARSWVQSGMDPLLRPMFEELCVRMVVLVHAEAKRWSDEAKRAGS